MTCEACIIRVVSHKNAHVKKTPCHKIVHFLSTISFGPFVEKEGESHTMALPVTFNSILSQKKNCGNSNIISPCKNIIFKKILKKKPKSFKILELYNETQIST